MLKTKYPFKSNSFNLFFLEIMKTRTRKSDDSNENYHPMITDHTNVSISKMNLEFFFNFKFTSAAAGSCEPQLCTKS
jgi:hypothetical protein